jgi:hypothetical protein
MIVMIVIGWAVALPLLVVLGLFCASKVLERRARTVGATGATDMTGFARQFSAVLSSESVASANATSERGSVSAAGY